MATVDFDSVSTATSATPITQAPTSPTSTRKHHFNPDGISAQSNKAVLVADQKLTFQDVLHNRLPAPFDWASFRQIAIDKFLVEENILFIEDYHRVVPATGASAASPTDLPGTTDELLWTSKEWYSKYLKTGAEWELNIPSWVKKTTKDQLPNNPDDGVEKIMADVALAWSPVYDHVVKMLQTDIFPKWARVASVQRNLSLSRQIALWWKHPVTVGEFFTFPNPVDKAEARCHAFCSTILAITAILLDVFTSFWYLIIPLTYGFLARMLCGPRLDPQAFLVVFVVRPIATKIGLLEHKFVPGPPRRFAQFVGLCFTAIALLCRALGYQYPSWILVGILILFSSLLALFDFCAACLIFGLAMQVGILPKRVCEACAIHYVDGHKDEAKTVDINQIAP